MMKRPDRDDIARILILLAALIPRFAFLTLKPPHADEGVNGYFVNQIWEKGFFSYDPTNFHGPLLFYLFQISEKIFGFGILSFRIVTALFSFLTVLLVLRGQDVLGKRASFFSAAALALSPGMVFFGRSAIHEAVFVFFQVLWMLGFLRLKERGDRHGLLWFIGGLLGCALLKETFVILGFAFLVAWAWTAFSSRLKGLPDGKSPQHGPVDKVFAMKASIAALIIWAAFYSGFFHHAKGLTDFFKALSPWFTTGMSGSGHEKHFSYWAELMVGYEWAGIAGLVAAFCGAFATSWKLRFFSVLALINFLIYSLIPYKTPWCIISILWPFFFVAGLSLESISDYRGIGSRLNVSLHAFASFLVLSSFAVRGYSLNFIDYADPSEPYVYVQTKKDLTILEDIIKKKTDEKAAYHNMSVQICLDESWPLPWIFSRFPNASFFDHDASFDTESDIIIADESRSGSELGRLYLHRRLVLRDGHEPLFVYFRKSLFSGADLAGFDMVRREGAGE